MPLDETSQAILGALNAGGGLDVVGRTPAEVRARIAALPSLPPGPDAQVESRKVAGGDGDIAARVYRPHGAEGTLPALIYTHGGGFVVGTLDDVDAVCRRIAIDARCSVISLDYRLAPEAQFPAAIEDAYAATRFVHENARELGIDPDRIAVGGDSAGGNLAAVVSQLIKERGGPRLALQVLLYPATTLSYDTPSHRENASGYWLTREVMEWFHSHYLPDHVDALDARVAPARAKDLTELPPALVVTAEYDPLRDEGEAYGEALRAAGVETTITRYDGTIHGFVTLHAFIPQGKQALTEAAAALTRAFG